MLKKIFKFRLPQPQNYLLALDVGTELVKALVVEMNEQKGKGVVRGVSRAQQSLTGMQAGVVTDIGEVIACCKEAVARAVDMAGETPSQVVLGIAGELVKGNTSIVRYERSDPEIPIKLSELKNIVHKVQWQAFERARAQLAKETGLFEIDVKLINAVIVDVIIDGVKVANPLEFRGKEVALSIFNAFAPLIHLGSLETIASELDLDLLAITAEPYAVSRCLVDPRVGDSVDLNAIFIDIGGGTTDIAVVINGSIVGTKMLAMGGRTFTKRLATTLKISFTEAEAVKKAYAGDNLNYAASKRVEQALQTDMDLWTDGVQLALGEFPTNEPLPHQIYLCGGGSALPEIKESLQDGDWWDELPFSRPPGVSFLQPHQVGRLTDMTGLLNEPADITPMALASFALDLAGEEKVVAQILRKVVKMMRA